MPRIWGKDKDYDLAVITKHIFWDEVLGRGPWNAPEANVPMYK